MIATTAAPSIEINGAMPTAYQTILTDEAIAFLTKLQRQFGQRRHDLLQQRTVRQATIDAGEPLTFLPETEAIRQGDWQVTPVPAGLQQRWVEITGPTDRKMVINALNSGAHVFMADFEDANSPTWANMVEGQINLRDANNRTIKLVTDKKTYQLSDNPATLFVRPRGWHLDERHLLIDGQPMSGSLFDFGLYFFHNATTRLANGEGTYYYLAKLESHHEAELWDDVFRFAQTELGLPIGTIKATVLIETITASLEMEEILYALRDHSAGLNAGRWDYIFSVIKRFRNRPVLLPDRAQITMTVPFMAAYSNLLVHTCHKRGAHAIGGMAAFIPNRRDPEVTDRALAKVRADKLRESTEGFDGTWVAHPDLVPMVRDIFEDALNGADHQKHRLRPDVTPDAVALTNFTIDGGTITEAGLRTNINVAILYLESWLRGTGAAALYNLMEDTATAEISRAQVWQWLQQDGTLDDGRPITAELCQTLIDEEMTVIHQLVGNDNFQNGQFEQARQLFVQLIDTTTFNEFLTSAAYQYLV